MKLVFYIYRLFLPLFIGSMITFAFILELVDLMMNIWKYIFNFVPPAVVGTIMLNFLPKTFTWAVPLSVLFASCFMLSSLYSKNELTALFASGISLIRWSMPLIVFAAFMSVALFVFQDKVVVKTSLKYDELKTKALRQQKIQSNDNIVIISEDGKKVYKAEYYDDESRRIHQLFVVDRNEKRELNTIIYSPMAYWNEEDGHWVAEGGVQYTYEDGMLKSGSVNKVDEMELTEPPETFRNNTISVESATVEESKAYIRHLQKAGLPFAESLSQYYNKFSFPFVVLIVAFLSIGISGKSQRNVFVISLTLSLGMAVLFYITQMITMLMAKFGMLPPLVGAWAPVVIFIGISFVLLKYTHT
ncbi:MAG: LptF/LptG family permease [Treponema sp.]|nr:LptF/LptG family permease [Treponema sp.]